MIQEKYNEVKDKIDNPALKGILASLAKADENFDSYQGKTDFHSICILLSRRFPDDNSRTVLAHLQGVTYSKQKTKKVKTEEIKTDKKAVVDADCPDCPQTAKELKGNVPDLETVKPKVSGLPDFIQDASKNTSKLNSNDVSKSVSNDTSKSISNVESVEGILEFFKDNKKGMFSYAKTLGLKFSNNIKEKDLAEKIFNHLK